MHARMRFCRIWKEATRNFFATFLCDKGLGFCHLFSCFFHLSSMFLPFFFHWFFTLLWFFHHSPQENITTTALIVQNRAVFSFPFLFFIQSRCLNRNSGLKINTSILKARSKCRYKCVNNKQIKTNFKKCHISIPSTWAVQKISVSTSTPIEIFECCVSWSLLVLSSISLLSLLLPLPNSQNFLLSVSFFPL